MQYSKCTAVTLSVAFGVLAATGTVAQETNVKPARPFQLGDYVGGGGIAPAAKPFQAGDFVGGGHTAVAAIPYKSDFAGGSAETTGFGGDLVKPRNVIEHGVR